MNVQDIIRNTSVEFELAPNANQFSMSRGSADAAGWDIFGTEDVLIHPGTVVKIPTGVKVKLPKGTVGILRTRSSSFKAGILVQGTIDSDYRGEVFLSVRNISDRPILVEANKSVAQMIVMYYNTLPCIKVDKVENDTARGEGGFGSTGNAIT